VACPDSTAKWVCQLTNILVVENGISVEFTPSKARLAGRITAGKVLVDGLGVGDVGNIVLRDRKQLSQDGIIIVVVTMNKEKGCGGCWTGYCV